MTLKRNTAEGQTNGTTLTAGNSGGGSGDAFTSIGGSGGAAIFSSAQAMHGTQSYDMSAASGSTIIPNFTYTATAQSAFQFYFRLPVLPSAAVTICQIRNSGGNAAKVVVLANNKLNIQNAAGATLDVFATTLLANTWYRVEVEVIPGTTTTNGTINCGYYLGDTAEGSPVDTRYASGATVNAGTTNLTQYQPGIASTAAAGTFHVFYDDIGFDTSTSTPIGVGAATIPGAPTAVIATPNDSQVSVAFTAPGSNGGSAITGYTAIVTDTITSTTFTNNNAASPIVVGGLTNGHLCSVVVFATNAVGNGPNSPGVTFTPDAVPGPPTALVASPGVAQASVAFTPPVSTGGTAITGYTATSTPGSFTGSGASSPIIVSGLTNGTAYTFTVHATNLVGNSVESAPSSAVTPISGLNNVNIRRSGVWVPNVPVFIRRSGAWVRVA